MKNKVMVFAAIIAIVGAGLLASSCKKAEEQQQMTESAPTETAMPNTQTQSK